MALVKLNFTEDEKNKLANLSMEVEIHEKRKFEINKNISDIGHLLNFATASRNPMVMRALRQFAIVMCPDTAHFLRILTVDVDKIKARNFQLMDETDRKTKRDNHNESPSPRKQKWNIGKMFTTLTRRVS